MQSYSGSPSTSEKDKVRFLVQDTGPTTFDFTDEEIEFLLSTEANFWMAAALLCDKLTTIKSSGGLASKSIGGLSESYASGSIQFYQSQGKYYRARGSGHQVPVADSELMDGQIFSVRQFDVPGSSDPPLREPRHAVIVDEELE